MTSLEVEFLRDIGAMIIDRAGVDTENLGDLFTGFVVGDKF